MTWTSASFALAALAVVVLILLAGIGARLNEIRSRIAVLSRVEAKLDLLLKQANTKFDPYANVPLDIVQALRGGRKIEAIKLYRQSTGVGAREAQELVAEG